MGFKQGNDYFGLTIEKPFVILAVMIYQKKNKNANLLDGQAMWRGCVCQS